MIERDEGLVLLGMLCAAFRQDSDEMMEEVWVQLLKDMEPHLALAAVNTYIELGEYFPKTSEFVGTVRELARREATQTIHAERSHSAFRCDGSRFRPSENQPGRMEPCPTCNPGLFDIFRDGRLLRLWLQCRALPDSTIVAASPEFPCGGVDDRESPEDRLCSPQRGQEVALAAYIEEKAAQGVEPDVEAAARRLRIAVG